MMSVSQAQEKQNPSINTKPYMIMNRHELNDTDCKTALLKTDFKFPLQEIPNTLKYFAHGSCKNIVPDENACGLPNGTRFQFPAQVAQMHNNVSNKSLNWQT